VGRACSAPGRGIDVKRQHSGIVLKPAASEGGDLVEDRSNQGLGGASAVSRHDAKKSLVFELGARR
jgi:hypothetical protein